MTGLVGPGVAGLATILADAAAGRFPPPDGNTTLVAQPSARDAGVLAFTAHTVLFLDEDPKWLSATLAAQPCDPLAATMHPRFLAALLDRTGRTTDTIDLLTAAPARPGPPPIPLTEITDPTHPRIRRALTHRDEVRAWTTAGGVLILGRGVAGRWEVALEVDEPTRHQGLGRTLASAARHLIPPGEWLWSQQATGNTRSIRAFQSAGFRPIAAEILLSPP